jgi:hypothetical protein
MPKAAATPIRAVDPRKQEILDKLGDISSYEIPYNYLLIAIYQRSQRTPSGLYKTANAVKEDVYQGKVGLVVKLGTTVEFKSTPVAVGDWIVVRPSDTWPLDINTRPEICEQKDFVACRMLFPDQIRARIPDPDMVW